MEAKTSSFTGGWSAQVGVQGGVLGGVLEGGVHRWVLRSTHLGSNTDRWLNTGTCRLEGYMDNV